MDVITPVLKNEGCEVKTAYFEKSSVEVGHKFSLYGFQVIYRIEGSELIICYLERNRKDDSLHDFLKLFNFIHQLGKRSAELSVIRMLVIDNVANSSLQLSLNRLIKILIAKGASVKSIEDNDWLLFNVNSK